MLLVDALAELAGGCNSAKVPDCMLGQARHLVPFHRRTDRSVQQTSPDPVRANLDNLMIVREPLANRISARSMKTVRFRGSALALQLRQSFLDRIG